MENREMNLCQGLADYMTGEMSDVERKRFERHLDNCPVCREDAAEWRHVWERLAEDAQPQELPSDLKDEVMGAIFGHGNEWAEAPKPGDADTVRPQRAVLRRFAFAAVVILAFAAGFMGREWMSQSAEVAAPKEDAPSRIEQLYRLAPAVETGGAYVKSANAYGVACILNDGSERKLVVYVFGAAKTEGGKAYHVWLLRGGSRSSAGTFTIDSSGVGLLTMPWPNDSSAFDQVGITLEPNAGTTVPQGPKVFGSAPLSDG